MTAPFAPVQPVDQLPPRKAPRYKRWVKVVFVIFTAVVGILVAAAISAPAPQAQAPAQAPQSQVQQAPVVPAAPDEPSYGPDSVFLTLVHDQKILPTLTDSQLVTLAHTVCSGLDKGYTPLNEADTIVTAARTSLHVDVSYYQAGYFVGASIGSYCQQHVGQVPTT